MALIQRPTSSQRMLPPQTDANFAFRFGVADAGVPGLAVPVLSGEPSETLFADMARVGREDGFALYASGEWLLGVQVVGQQVVLDAQTEAVYASLLKIVGTRRLHLARIWNYVADINGGSPEGLEIYRVFCRGRSHAFERAGWTAPLPAASAVGGEPGRLAVVFAATRERPRAFENPEQVPAFEYPADYGPRSPSFSRAMQVTADGRRWTFVSGTAAIKGHRSLAAGDLAGQIACTLDNLRIVSERCGLGTRLAAGAGVERHFKIYLRNPADLAVASGLLEGTLLLPSDRVTWLRSDVCRAELLIEIECTVVG